MNKSITRLLKLAMLIATFTMQAQDIKLPTPDTTGGLPVNQAFAQRRSDRTFDSSRPLPWQTVSDLLWATCGINRPETGLRTNPTARNWQEIDAYWFDSNGVYRYDYAANELVLIAGGDHRTLVCGTQEFSQDFVLEAPASIVLVVDASKLPDSDHARAMAMMDAGIACQNINLFCAGNGLATVARATMDIKAISDLLGLSEGSYPALNNPVGFPVK